jgi:hypothetical protein
MTKRNVGGMLLALAVSITAAIASCTFPTYEIIVTGTTGSTGDASATASSSSSGGGDGGASSTSSTSSGNGGSGGSGGSSTSSTSSASSTSSVSSTSSGACTTDADGDTYVSVKCPGGTDCADGDVLANPKGDFHAFSIQNPPAGTQPFDFNCNGNQETETPVVTSCGADCSTEGFSAKVACGDTGPTGKCGGVFPLCSFTLYNPTVTKVQRCK